ncbi:hypothetical protein ACGFMM_09955 [Streptomyces sp. NPDC048604]|uniref:hypothetical protein n=1 Tax=Streptomyces sp. NPDC048604 TaxID=3365578 RepID=UPI0037124B39
MATGEEGGGTDSSPSTSSRSASYSAGGSVPVSDAVGDGLGETLSPAGGLSGPVGRPGRSRPSPAGRPASDAAGLGSAASVRPVCRAASTGDADGTADGAA